LIDRVISGPSSIVSGWASLNKADFKVVDAVLSNPLDKEQAWFFSGEKYVKVSWRPGESLSLLTSFQIALMPCCRYG